MSDVADAVRALAGLLRAGLTLHTALLHWCEVAMPSRRAQLERIARRVTLGAPAGKAVGTEFPLMPAILDLHTELGGNLPAALDELALAIEGRAAKEEAARAAAAGAVLSARLVAVLPLVTVPLLAAAGAPLLDPLGLVVVVAGVGLAVGGLWWMERLLPRPPAADSAADLAEAVAAAVAGGASLPSAMQAAVSQLNCDVTLLQRVKLGVSWPASLARADDPGVRMLAAVVTHAERSGTPITDSLRGFAGTRRAHSERVFETSLRRAQVHMVLPLTLCVLPSFALLTLAPFFRGLAV